MNKIVFGVLFVLVSLITITLSGCGRVEQSEVETSSNPKKTEIDCEAPCVNFVDKCLTLVPGATQQLFVDGQTSCAKECEGWNAEKAECILNAENCTLMIEECKL